MIDECSAGPIVAGGCRGVADPAPACARVEEFQAGLAANAHQSELSYGPGAIRTCDLLLRSGPEEEPPRMGEKTQ